ncbi:MAG: rhodanese-like domain-containing protein [Planctomycetota bacterium]
MDGLLTPLNTSAVSEILNDSKWVVVDTRPSDAYNGWKLNGVRRGGHLPGAIDFPANWLDSDKEDTETILSEALQTKGMTPEHRVLLYSTNQSDLQRVAGFLQKRGFKELHGYNVNQWAMDPEMPLIKYPTFQLIVPAIVVKDLMDGKRPETFEDTIRVKFVEASWGDEKASYRHGHVPGSFHVNTDHFEPPPSWMLGDLGVLTGFASRYGFQHDDTVIVTSKDPIASFRLAVVLRSIGVRDVRVLNGGLDAWTSAGFELERKRHDAPKATSFGTPILGRSELICDMKRVKNQLPKSSSFTAVDTRTWAEFIGEASGYSDHKQKGRIPGSVYGQHEFRGNDSMKPYRNIDKTMRNAGEIQLQWVRSGVDPTKHLSFFCGSGWRAAEVLTYANVMDFTNCSLYSDGWIGWSNDPSNPTEVGDPNADGS